jgi:hypothetical protein
MMASLTRLLFESGEKVLREARQAELRSDDNNGRYNAAIDRRVSDSRVGKGRRHSLRSPLLSLDASLILDSIVLTLEMLSWAVAILVSIRNMNPWLRRTSLITSVTLLPRPRGDTNPT